MYHNPEVTTYTDQVLLERTQNIMQNIRQDSIRVSIEIHSNFQTEDMTAIPDVSHEEPCKIVHCNDMIADQPVECQQPSEPSAEESAGQSAEPSPCPSAGPQGRQRPKVAIFSEPSIDEFVTPQETPAKVLVK